MSFGESVVFWAGKIFAESAGTMIFLAWLGVGLAWYNWKNRK